MKVKAILFDLDDTLINDTLGTRLAFEQALKIIGNESKVTVEEASTFVRNRARHLWQESPHNEVFVSLGISSSEALFSDFEIESEFFPKLPSWAMRFQKQVWRDTLAHCMLSNEKLAQRLSNNYKKFRIECVSVFDGTIQTLETLSSHYKLAIVTNGPADLQGAKIGSAKLEKYFESILVSGREGVGKPDPEVFRRMLGALQVAPEDTMMVGDSYASDILGAQRAGIRAIRIGSSTNGSHNPNESVPMIQGIEDLQGILGNT